MTNSIKTRADGSIDTAHYIARGRQLRSRAARDLLQSAPRTGSANRLAWAIVPLAMTAAALLIKAPLV